MGLNQKGSLVILSSKFMGENVFCIHRLSLLFLRSFLIPPVTGGAVLYWIGSRVSINTARLVIKESTII